jgi:hypothetical protein
MADEKCQSCQVYQQGQAGKRSRQSAFPRFRSDTQTLKSVCWEP